ncbi:hypothetical protein GCM10010912_40620 [Paenibacillus albidus]|uniref:Intimin n=1 Tax=Paenibacillus albidus TaxID=2041023 RepID=A0A917CKB9_9BACL|nr:S-layer homology domain-containing protein [Paenibacillus albidus]GGF91493.1 hypothetical protein GCM10010912_40620 [Paenibacillus albidus]
MRQGIRITSLFISICVLFSIVHPLTLPAYADAVKWVTYQNEDFSDANQLGLFALNGQAKAQTDGKGRKVLRLTEAVGNRFGTAFNKKLISTGNHYSFSTFFKFRMNESGSANPADGITFTIQAQSNDAGSVGVGLGYGGIKPSFAVKYDTYENGSPVNDPSDNYIGLALNGNVNNTNPNWQTTNLNGIRLAGGEDLYSWIDYDGNSKTVKVYLSKTLARPATPVLETSGIDLDTVFAGKAGVYAGFTAATGGAMETHDILSWYFVNELDPIDTQKHTYKQAPTDIRIETVPTGQPGQYQVKATALDVNGNPVEGAPITFSSKQGDLTDTLLTSGSNGQATTLLNYGNNPPSGEISVSTVGGAYATVEVPPAPIKLTSGTTAETANQLSWNSVTQATYYNLYKDGILYASNINDPFFKVTDMTPGEFASFTVTAVTSNDSGIVESGPSNQVTLPVTLGLSIDSTKYNLPTGATHQTVVSSVYSDGTVLDVTGYSHFNSTDGKVATVGPDGVVKAVGAGTTVVEAVYNGKIVTANVTVNIEAPASVTAEQVTSNGAKLSWSAVPYAQSYEIYDNGKLIASGITEPGYEVTGLQPGTPHSFTVKAVSNGISSPASKEVKATTTSLRDLLIDPASITLVPGDIHQPKVTAVRLDESLQDVTGIAVYTSSNPKVAVVDAEGKITAVAPGTAVITAAFEGRTVTETVTVQNKQLPYTLELSVSPASAIGDGKTPVTVTAKATAADGSPVAGVPVEFTLESGEVLKGVTNDQGIAVVTYTPKPIQGIIPTREAITATAKDPASGLVKTSSTQVVYYPAAVKGIVFDQITGQPAAGASVTVEADFDGDGVIDFSAEIITGADGSYQIPVPRGNFTYQLSIQTPVQIDGQKVVLKETQTAVVGSLNNAGLIIESAHKLSGQLFIAAAAGQSAPVPAGGFFGKGQAFVEIEGLDGNKFKTLLPLDADGRFELDQISAGKYKITYQLKAPDGTVLTSPSEVVNVNENGQLGVVYSLVDPYGTVTDAFTGSTLSDVKVELYWADTAFNRQKGRLPNTLVDLPLLPDFPLNQNKNPQLTDLAGQYAWMTFPEGDYYIVATRSGYAAYSTLNSKVTLPKTEGSDSYIENGIIHIGKDILAFNFAMQPVSSGGPSNPSVVQAPAANLGFSLIVDNDQVKEGGQSTITVDYKNLGASTLGAADLTITLPEGAELVSADGGTVNGRTITWKLSNVPAYGTGNFKVVVKWGNLNKASEQYDILGQFTVAGNAAGSAKSSVKVNVYSDRFGELKHYRYILGYPDKQFKLNSSLTRAELAAIVARLTENETVSYKLPFNDIRAGHWATNYIRIATKHGYFTGDASGEFRPDAPVTRGELATVMARFLKLQVSIPSSAHFADTAGHWSGNAVEALFNGKFLSGYPDGSFKPNSVITRVEAVTMINRMLYRGPLQGLTPQFPDVPANHWGFGDVQEATYSHEAIRNEDGSEQWTRALSDGVQ